VFIRRSVSLKRSIVVCDRKPGFAERMADYVNKRRLSPFLMESFTDVNLLQEYGMRNRIAVLLIDEAIYSEELKKLNIDDVYLLVEDRNSNQMQDQNRLYKYSPIPEIMKDVMCSYANRSSAMSTNMQCGRRIIGAFTPALSIGHTSFLLTLALVVAEKKKAIYLPIRSTYGYRKMLKKLPEADLSDVMYSIIANKETAEIDEYLLHYDNLDYILPAATASDLHSVEAADWEELFSLLASKEYDYIFIDLDESISGCHEVLARCDLIYASYDDSYECKMAFEEYEETISRRGLFNILEKMIKINPVENSIKEDYEDLFLSLKKGKMGDYVRGILQNTK